VESHGRGTLAGRVALLRAGGVRVLRPLAPTLSAGVVCSIPGQHAAQALCATPRRAAPPGRGGGPRPLRRGRGGPHRLSL